MATGLAHTCGIKAGGELWCWGLNHQGQLGDATTEDRTSPVQVGDETDWARVDLGGAHSCGVRRDGQLWCWGTNDAGHLGGSAAGHETMPIQIAIPPQ